MSRREAVLRDAVAAVSEAVAAIQAAGDGEVSMDDLGDRLYGSSARAGFLPETMREEVESLADRTILRASELVAADVNGTLQDALEEGEKLRERLRAAARAVRRCEVEKQNAIFSRSGVEQRQQNSMFNTPEMQEAFRETNREVGRKAKAVEKAWEAWEVASEELQRRCRLVALGPAAALVQKPEPDERGRWA